MNICMFRGNLVRDPEVRSVNGTKVATFRLAVNNFYRDKKNGELKEITTFLDMECWNSKAEVIGSLLKRGSLVTVQCSARTQSWEREGVKRSRILFRVDNFWFDGKRKIKTEEDMKENKESKELSPF